MYVKTRSILHAEVTDTTELCVSRCNCSDLHLKTGKDSSYDRFICNFPVRR